MISLKIERLLIKRSLFFIDNKNLENPKLDSLYITEDVDEEAEHGQNKNH